MFVLADFSVIKPDFGLLFWTSLIFLLFWFLIGKMAFAPIARALKKREDDIQDALDEAKRAREEMSDLKAENEQLLAQAREERALILKEAKEIKNSIVTEAKTKAKDEADKIVTNARQEIENQKKAAIIEVKNEMGKMALGIAEKIIVKDLQADKAQQEYAERLVKELNLN